MRKQELGIMAKRVLSDAKLIKLGAQYVFDEKTKSLRLEFQNEAYDSVYEEYKEVMIEKGDWINVHQTSKTIWDIEKKNRERNINLSIDRRNVSSFMGNSKIRPILVVNFLEKFDQKIISLENSRNFIIIKCCDDWSCDVSYLFEIEKSKKEILESEYRHGYRGYQSVIFKEACESFVKVDFLSAMEYGELIEKAADVLIRVSIKKREKEEAQKIKEVKAEEERVFNLYPTN